MKKILNWIKKNTGLFIVLLLTLVLLVFIGIIFVKLLIGNKVEEVNEVVISKETYDEVKKEVTDTELVEKVDVRTQKKSVYTTIILKSDTSVDSAKNIASNTLDNYDEDELGFYDFSFFLKWEGEESDTVVIGNKHHDLDAISWVES